ncbi:CAMK family protein kinase, partial [Corchorus capsularis]
MASAPSLKPLSSASQPPFQPLVTRAIADWDPVKRSSSATTYSNVIVSSEISPVVNNQGDEIGDGSRLNNASNLFVPSPSAGFSRNSKNRAFLVSG